MRDERTIYQLVTIFSFVCFVAAGMKYSKLKAAYQDAEKEKNEYCVKYHKLKCNIK